MIVISHEQATELYDYGPLIDFMEEQHKLAPAHLSEMWTESAEGNGLLARTGFAPGTGLGVKMATVFPGNVDMPSIFTVYVLFDPTTGEEQAVIASNALTWFKTACDSGLGSRHLARDDSTHLLMVGAGSMAPHMIRAHMAARPSIQQVTIWNRSRQRAETLARHLDVGATVADDLRTAVENADIVSCATMTIEPLIRGRWLRPGTHVDLVGSYKPDMREADDDALRRSRIFVDSRSSTLEPCGELKIPLDRGVITEADIVGDHYQLATGTVVGRTSDQDITLFKNGGGGHLDLMAAQFLMTRL